MKQEYIIIHHTASSPKTSVKSVDSWHKDRNFPKSSLGYYIGYHYLIGIDYIHRARKESEIGVHAGSEWNPKSLGICLTGNFNVDQPTEYQKMALNTLLNALMYGFNIPKEKVIFHRDTKATACPGKNITKELIDQLIINRMKFQNSIVRNTDEGGFYFFKGSKDFEMARQPLSKNTIGFAQLTLMQVWGAQAHEHIFEMTTAEIEKYAIVWDFFGGEDQAYMDKF